eukprot:650868-Hanusia_phi.AAC.1
MALGRSLIRSLPYFLLLMISAFLEFVEGGAPAQTVFGMTSDRTHLVHRSAAINSACIGLHTPGSRCQFHPPVGMCGSTSLPYLSFHLF